MYPYWVHVMNYCVCVCICSHFISREIDEREEMMEDEIEKRLAVAQKSMKKLYSTKR